MKFSSLVFLLLLLSQISDAQEINKIINEVEVKRILTTLSSDEMAGRKTNTPGIEAAAKFISEEFSKAKLDPFTGLENYRQPVTTFRAKILTVTGTINDNPVHQDNIVSITTDPDLKITETSNYTRLRIDSSLDLMKEASRLMREKKNYVIFVDSSHAANFPRLKRLKRESFKMNNSVVFVLTNANPLKYNFDLKHELAENQSANIVAMIPGKTIPGEYVIFSAHYDHLGIGKPNAAGDSIYNGANDNASGTTAMLLLAKYFNKLKTNDRTLIFVAFTAEESGGYGSRHFSTQINPDKVVAMFNIEMVGTGSKWGNNSAYITGFEKSDMGVILQKNLSGTDFKFEPDPYPKANLFYRSDNATLAALGVPAHTISTSRMDEDKLYHTTEDEIESLDLKNMTEIIKAIALSSKTIIKGTDTPSRVEKMN